VCHADAGPVAGIMEITADLPADMPSHWVQYIGTRDVDGTAEAAVRAGGSVMKAPSDMQGAGRYAIIKDPQGAAFAIIDPENARPEPAGMPPPGNFSWHELATTDHEAAFAFYSALFGWEALQRMDMGPNGIYLIFGQNGVQRGGMYIPSSNQQMPPNWMPYIQVPDTDKGYALATSTGARSLAAPMDVPGGSRIACLFDPAGAPVSIVSTPAAAAGGEQPKAASGAKPKAKPKAKAKAAKKPAAKKTVVKKAAKKAAKKVARKSRKAAPKKKAPAKKAKAKKAKAKKAGARRKK
jgi:predicted enzyme related to lactoylglutathione lyase